MISAAPLKVDIRRAHVWPVAEKMKGWGVRKEGEERGDHGGGGSVGS